MAVYNPDNEHFHWYKCMILQSQIMQWLMSFSGFHNRLYLLHH